MTSCYYYYRKPLGFCFLVQIRAFVISTSLGLANLNIKEKRNDSGLGSNKMSSWKWAIYGLWKTKQSDSPVSRENKQPHRKRTKYLQVESEIPSCVNSKTKHQGSQNEAPSIPVKNPTNNLHKSVNFKCYFRVLPSSTHKKEKKRRRNCDQRSGLFSFSRKEENERQIVIKERMMASPRKGICCRRGLHFQRYTLRMFAVLWSWVIYHTDYFGNFCLELRDEIFLRFGRFSTCYCWIYRLFFVVITVFGNPTYPLRVCYKTSFNNKFTPSSSCKTVFV